MIDEDFGELVGERPDKLIITIVRFDPIEVKVVGHDSATRTIEVQVTGTMCERTITVPLTDLYDA